MKRFFVVLLFAVILATSAISAADEEQYMKYEADCRKFAQEDSVLAEDMDAYIEQCMRDMTGAFVEMSETPPDAGENRE
ncbi:MAG: hypothetical protein ABW161_07025 [Candidatus Thiodiazotropha sp.]